MGTGLSILAPSRWRKIPRKGGRPAHHFVLIQHRYRNRRSFWHQACSSGSLAHPTYFHRRQTVQRSPGGESRSAATKSGRVRWHPVSSTLGQQRLQTASGEQSKAGPPTQRLVTAGGVPLSQQGCWRICRSCCDSSRNCCADQATSHFHLGTGR